MAVPKLKFKADDGSKFPEWEEKCIDTEFDFYNGVAHENNVVEKGKYIVVNSKFISSDGKIKKYSDVANFPLMIDDIVMVMSDVPNGKAIAKCFLIDKNDTYTLNQRICCLRTKHNAIFMLNQINRNNYFLRFDDGIKQTNLRKEDILRCPIYVPSVLEQQKIAEFLSTIDEIIQSTESELTAWQERKKGVIQKIFNREVRFKADDGSEFPEWEEKKLGDVTNRLIRRNKNIFSDIPLTISATYGLIDQREYFNKTVAAQDLSNYYLLQKGEFAYNRSSSAGYDFGVIKRLDTYECGAVSTLYICFSIEENSNVYSDYLSAYFNSNAWNKYAASVCAEGARNHGLLNISIEDFFGMPVLLPSLPEQKKIADCLSSLDDVVNQIHAELSAWKEFKKGLLQQMFL